MAKAESKTNSSRVPFWEQAVAAFGLLLVLGIIGLLLFEAVSEPRSAPDISLEAETPIKINSNWHVPIKAINRGGSAAAELTVAAELHDRNSRIVEAAELTFDLLAPRSSRTGGVYFTNDPNTFQLRLHARSYVSP